MVSDAAVKLTTAMLDYRANNPTAGWAEALRRSMLALVNIEEKPHYAHPLFWAPFVVVGEGAFPRSGECLLRIMCGHWPHPKFSLVCGVERTLSLATPVNDSMT